LSWHRTSSTMINNGLEYCLEVQSLTLTNRFVSPQQLISSISQSIYLCECKQMNLFYTDILSSKLSRCIIILTDRYAVWINKCEILNFINDQYSVVFYESVLRYKIKITEDVISNATPLHQWINKHTNS